MMVNALYYQFTDEELIIVARDIAQDQEDQATQQLIEELCDRLRASIDGMRRRRYP